MLLAFERYFMANVLLTRVVSAVALAVPAIAAVYIGYPFFEILIAIAACVLVWEWCHLWNAKAAESVLIALFLLGGMAATILARLDIAIGILFAGMIIVYALSRGNEWLSAGVIYLGVPIVALVWLRNTSSDGRNIIFWIFALVWASDVGAYAAGRLIGGPKLAPSISPSKTWAGLVGAVVSAGIVGAVTASVLQLNNMWFLVIMSSGLGFVAQAGDFLESWFKRRVGVKDSSGLIPGHGGLLDRVDALIAVLIVTSLISGLGKCGVLQCL